MEKILYKALNLIFIAILIVPSTLAVGLTGGVFYKKFFFEPGLKEKYDYVVTSNTVRPMDHLIYLTGDDEVLSYFHPSKDILFLKPGEQKPVSLVIEFPLNATLDPGKYRVRFCIEEAETRTPTSNIGAKTAVCTIFDVYSPYPGKKIEAKIEEVKDVNVGENSSVKINVLNLGTEPAEVKGKIIIKKDNKEIKQFRIKPFYLDIKSEKIVEQKFSTEGLESGMYNLVVELYYDNQKETTNASLSVGKPIIKIIDYTKEIESGKINEFKIKIKNLWNKEMENVFGEITIMDQLNNSIAQFSTSVTNVKAYEEKELVGYFDPKNIDIGEYSIIIEINYGQEKIKKYSKIRIKEKTMNLETIIKIIIIIAIIILIYLIIKKLEKKKKRKKRYEKKYKRYRKKKKK